MMLEMNVSSVTKMTFGGATNDFPPFLPLNSAQTHFTLTTEKLFFFLTSDLFYLKKEKVTDLLRLFIW